MNIYGLCLEGHIMNIYGLCLEGHIMNIYGLCLRGAYNEYLRFMFARGI